MADGQRITLEQLAGLLEGKFENWIVHFGASSLLEVSPTRLQDFAAATRVALLAGYKQEADGLAAAAMDVLLLGSLQEYKDMPSLWTRVTEHYRELVRRTGLQIIALG